MAARQAVQNPHAGDGYAAGDGKSDKDKPYTLPMVGATPKEVLIAGVTGGPIGLALNLLSDNAIGHAKAFEQWWGIRHINNLLDKASTPQWLARQSWWRQFDYHPEISNRYPELIQAGKTHAEAIQSIKEEVMQAMKARHLDIARNNFNKTLKPHWQLIGKATDATAAYARLIDEELKADSPAFLKLKETDFLKKLGMPEDAAKTYVKQATEPGLKSFFDEIKAAAEKNASTATALERQLAQFHTNAEALGIKSAEDFARNYEYKVPDLRSELTGHNVEQALDGLEGKIAHLEAKEGTLAPAEGKLLNSLRALRDRMNCSQSMGHYEQKALLHAEMRASELKPLGRMYTQFWSQLRSLFGGEAAIGGMVSHGGLGGRLFGAVFGSMFMVAPAVHAASEAKKGDKKAAFFENFIGFGLFNLFGWEVGRHLLNSTKLIEKLLGRHSLKHPFAFLKYVPIIGEGLGRKVGQATHPALGSLLGNNMLGRWLGRMTLAGFITEIIAMFIFGGQFEKMGNWVSHKIFGKPAPKEPDQNKKDKSPTTAPQGLPASGSAALAGNYPPVAGAAYPTMSSMPSYAPSSPASSSGLSGGYYPPPTGAAIANQGFSPATTSYPLPQSGLQPGVQDILNNPLYQQSTNAANYFNNSPPGA